MIKTENHTIDNDKFFKIQDRAEEIEKQGVYNWAASIIKATLEYTEEKDE